MRTASDILRLMRLFFGIGIPPNIRSEIDVFIQTLKPRLPRMKWVKAENLHITLRFLGDVEEAKLSVLGDAARGAQGSVSEFDAKLGGLGAFPAPGKARVVWLGLASGHEESAALFNSLEANLVKAGFPPERRRYHPHVTLARLRHPAPLPLEEFDPPVLSFRAAAFTLYKSTLTPGGPIYEVIEEFEIGG